MTKPSGGITLITSRLSMMIGTQKWIKTDYRYSIMNRSVQVKRQRFSMAWKDDHFEVFFMHGSVPHLSKI
ncbi:MAG: hypothetical protein WA941_22770 [Nitrososphaeraceae archaeon]